jgi:hypothetical protein
MFLCVRQDIFKGCSRVQRLGIVGVCACSDGI